MLSRSFARNLTRSARQDPVRRALKILTRALKANQPEPACYLLYFTPQAGWIEASSVNYARRLVRQNRSALEPLLAELLID